MWPQHLTGEEIIKIEEAKARQEKAKARQEEAKAKALDGVTSVEDKKDMLRLFLGNSSGNLFQFSFQYFHDEATNFHLAFD